MKGYIYIRSHPSYENACKLGIASNILDRDATYTTGELRKGNFTHVFEVEAKQMRLAENLLKHDLKEHHIYYGGGTEFFSQEVGNMILPLLQKRGIKCRTLLRDEIESINRTKRLQEILKKVKPSDLLQALEKVTTKHLTMNPRPDQVETIEKAVEFYERNDKGLLVLTCGVGKTLISLWITQRMSCQSIVIGVPNRLLLSQWEDKVKLLYPQYACFSVSSGVGVTDISKVLATKRYVVMLTTYSSSHKVRFICQQMGYTFDMKILDEAHHLTSFNLEQGENNKDFIQMLFIPSRKQIGLTATLKYLETDDSISNKDVEHFGEVIERRSLLWAISQNIVCDYVIQSIVAREEQMVEYLNKFRIHTEVDKRLFLSAFTSLKSIKENHSHHLLIYCNNKEHALRVMHFISRLIEENYFPFSNQELFFSSYHSELRPLAQKQILNAFQSHKFGILSCVYCLGEGWDFPLLDGVVFAENMTSSIRIVQSLLRASRVNPKEPNKKAKIILPVIHSDDWFIDVSENTDLKKVKRVIYQVGLEDENIIEKLKAFRITMDEPKEDPSAPTATEMEEEFGEYDEEFTQRLRLKTRMRSSLTMSFEKLREVVKKAQVFSKEEYWQLCETDYRLPKDPENMYKGQFTNWIEFFGLDFSQFYSLEESKRKATEMIAKSPHLRTYKMDYVGLCSQLRLQDSKFPPSGLWCELYKIPDLNSLFDKIVIRKASGLSSLL